MSLRTLRALRPLSTPSSSSSSIRAFSTTPSQNFARMTVIGRLAADAEVVPTSSGRDLLRYSIGSDSGPKDNRITSWFRIVTFPESPEKKEIMENLLKKGSLVHVEATSRMRSYEDSNGTRRTNLELIQRSVDVLARPRGTSANEAPAEDAAEAEAATA